jgi:4-hydroxy-tetrahydrodipicolinate synthase
VSNVYRSGIIPAPITPFNPDCSIDWPTFDDYIGEIAESGVVAIAINMAAAEVTSLEPEEQYEAIRRAKKIAEGVKIVGGLVATYTQGAVNHGQRVLDAGADALVVFPPLPTFSSKPITPEVIVAHHKTIAEKLGCPIIAFNTGNATYPHGTIRAMSEIANIVAIKDAAFNIELTAEMVEEAQDASNKLVVMTGNDTFILESLLLGCPGALIGYAGTVTAELIEMQRLAAERKITEAYEIWDRLGPLARVVWRAPLRDYRPRMKYVLMRQGVIPNMVTRAPQPELNARDRADLDRLFDKFGYETPRYRPRGR